MAETSPTSPEKAVVVTSSHLGRLWTLTIASLTLNALILALILIGAIIHHHQMRHGFGGRGGPDDGYRSGHSQFGWGHHFHHFGGPGWGSRGGCGGDEGAPYFGDNGRDPRGDFGPGPGGPPPGMPGMDQADPGKMTDRIMNHLSEKLSLTEDEKSKIKPIIDQQVADIQKQREAQRMALQKQIEDAKARIKPLLTADQQKQLDEISLPGQKPPAPDEANRPPP